MKSRMKKLVLSIQGKSMQKQLDLLTEEFNNWKASEEQIDDVCVMGVKIT
jgi:hypothetical protein